MRRPGTALVLDLGAAVAASLLLWALWPRVAAPVDPLRNTAFVVPWMVVVLRWAMRRTGAAPATFTALPWTAAAALLALLLREQSALGGSPAVWAGALGLLLVLALARLIPRLRRLRRPSDPVFFVLPLAVYLVLQPWALAERPPDGDEPYYLLIAHSLSEDLDTDLADEYRDGAWRRFIERPLEPQPGDPRGPAGAIHSRHDPLLPALLAPAYRLAGRAGAAATLAAITAGVAWLTLGLAMRLWPTRRTGALLAWALLAFTPPLLVYSHQIWIEVPAALFALVAFDRLQALSAQMRAGHSPTVRDLLLFTVAACLLPLLKARLLLVAVPLVVLALVRLRRHLLTRVGALVVLPPTAVVAALLVYNAERFGNPLKMYGRGDLEALASPASAYVAGLVGMFWDCAFGLFAAAPVWLLLVPALWLVARTAWAGDRSHRRLLVDVGVVSTPYLMAIAPRLEWYGGWAPAFRYPLVLLPILALLLVPLLERRTTGTRIACAALVPVTIGLALVAVAVPGWTYHLADGSSTLLQLLGADLRADVARLFPSTVRPRAATWVWVLGTLGLAPLVAAGRIGGRRRVRARGVGAALLLGALALLPQLAHRLPTRVVDVEDAWVTKTRGELVPERWVIQRPLHRGGWLIPAGGMLTAPVVPGGERVVLVLDAARRGFRGPDTLEIRAGDQLLDTWTVEGGAWRTHQIGPIDWPADAPLVLYNPQKARRKTVGVIVDRVAFDWQDGSTEQASPGAPP
ncbi:MAG: hypothetical protein AAGC60_12625 [Acidobacteriota bacterium]